MIHIPLEEIILIIQNLSNRTVGMIYNMTNSSVESISSYVFVLCAGLLLGHRQQPKGGCLAHAAKEEAEVWRAGESADRNCKFSKKQIFLHMVFFCYSFCLCLLGFSILLCLCLRLCTSASVSFPFALLSLPLYSTVSLPHANRYTGSVGVHSQTLCNCSSMLLR